MHFIPLSILAAALIAAAAPSPDPAEITIKIDLPSDNDAAGNFPAPLDFFPGLDITENHGGDGPNLHEGKFNLYHNFSLRAWIKDPKKPPKESFLVGYRPGVPFAEFSDKSNNFTLCRGHLLYDNYVFTIGPPPNPVYIFLGPSHSASIFETETVGERVFIRFNNAKLGFASLNGLPRKGDRVAALSGQPRSLFTLFSSSLSPLSLFLPLTLTHHLKRPLVVYLC